MQRILSVSFHDKSSNPYFFTSLLYSEFLLLSKFKALESSPVIPDALCRGIGNFFTDFIFLALLSLF